MTIRDLILLLEEYQGDMEVKLATDIDEAPIEGCSLVLRARDPQRLGSGNKAVVLIFAEDPDSSSSDAEPS